MVQFILKERVVSVRQFLYVLLALLSFSSSAQCAKMPTVAITQIISHPSLDAICKGVIDELQENGFTEGKGTKIMFDNASGNITIATQIAQKFASLNSSVIVAITTPSAQSVLKAIQDTKIPLVFSAVTDPVGAGLLESLQKSSEQVTGTIDLPPIAKQLDIIKVLQPQARKIGILYSLGEANAVFQVEQFTKLAQEQKFEIIKVGIAKASDIQQAAAKLIQQVDLIMLFNDNLIISSVETIVKEAHVQGIPVFTSDPESVERGALAAVANDQYQIGRQTGKMLVTLLQGTPIQQIPPQKVDIAKVYINKEVANHLKILPEQLKQAEDLFKN